MTKLCPRGKAAAKRKFKVYPSAYANAYASKICAGKIKDPSGVKRKDFRGSKAKGGRIGYDSGDIVRNPKSSSKFSRKELELLRNTNRKTDGMKNKRSVLNMQDDIRPKKSLRQLQLEKIRKNKAGGGLMEATQRLKRQGLRGGGICKKGMNRQAVGKNS